MNLGAYILREHKARGNEVETVHINLAHAVRFATEHKVDVFSVISPSNQVIYAWPPIKA